MDLQIPDQGFLRRDMLRIGSLAAFGISLTDLFRRPSAAHGGRTAKSCILLWLDGGPSHLETFDPKPDAPLEVRGPFATIGTNVPGVQLCEHLPRMASICDKIAIVRSVTSPLGEHGLANQYLLTGYKPSPVLDYPSFGSVVSYLRSTPAVLPSYVSIPETRYAGAGFLGNRYEPFATGGDPAHPQFHVRDLDFFPGVDETRILRRRAFLAELDAAQATHEARDVAVDSAFERAYRLITSQEAKQAFDLSRETSATRARFGPRMFGQSCLLARRLVERGVPFVTVVYAGWDTHQDLVLQLRDGYTGAKSGVGLIPTFDLGFSALIGDLAERGLLEETLVVAMGEFGRTPKLNTHAGRDHWPRVFSVVCAGGGVAGGQVIGASDRVGEVPHEYPVTPMDLACSIYELLGIKPNQELRTPDGRPVPVNQGGQSIRGLRS